MTTDSGKFQVCQGIMPGKTNYGRYGCIKPEGHRGLHVNGSNEAWLNSPEQDDYRGACWNAIMEEETKESLAKLYIDVLRQQRKAEAEIKRLQLNTLSLESVSEIIKAAQVLKQRAVAAEAQVIDLRAKLVSAEVYMDLNEKG